MSSETLLSLFNKRTNDFADRVVFKQRQQDHWIDITWEEWRDTAEKIASWLISIGVEPGDRVCIFSNTRAEWAFADAGIMMSGALTVPIYQSNTAEQSAFIVNDSKAKVIFCEDPNHLGKINSLREKLPSLKHLVYISSSVHLSKPDSQGRSTLIVSDVSQADDETILSWEELLIEGGRLRESSQNLLLERREGVQADTLATIVYTSGTTGVPKGVMLTHGSLIHSSVITVDLYQLTEDDVCLCFLPLAHLFGKCILTIQLLSGYQMAFDANLASIAKNLQEIKPTFTAMVPRVLEKFYARLKEAPPHVIKGAFGGNLRVCLVSGAALSAEINEFFTSRGIPLYEGYASTEASGIISGNTPNHRKVGTVGMPVPGAEIRIAGDGEILLHAPNLMKGYYNRPEENQSALKEIDGKLWYHTGDVGEFDTDNFLRITDRKKNLFKTSGGKYIAPQMLENLVKSNSEFVSQIVVYGENRNFVIAILTLNEEALVAWAQSNDIDLPVAKLVRDSRVQDLVVREIRVVNNQLASFETIKKFLIVYPDLSVDTDELTPTGKVKRKKVFAKYQVYLDSMYS